MLYGMLLSSELLEAFAALGWIGHPNVSSALVVASLQKEGDALKEATKGLEELSVLVKANQAVLKNLKKNNTNLNM